MAKKEKVIIGPKSPKQEMILNSEADITVIGGAAPERASL